MISQDCGSHRIELTAKRLTKVLLNQKRRYKGKSSHDELFENVKQEGTANRHSKNRHQYGAFNDDTCHKARAGNGERFYGICRSEREVDERNGHYDGRQLAGECSDNDASPGCGTRFEPPQGGSIEHHH